MPKYQIKPTKALSSGSSEIGLKTLKQHRLKTVIMRVIKTQLENHGIRIYGTGSIKLIHEDWELSDKKNGSEEVLLKKNQISNDKK